MGRALRKAEVVKALKQQGATKVREGANHEVWHCACGRHRTAVPRHRVVTAGVVANIVKQMECHREGWLQ
jgi:predicted RNA binding protein YcfA (HicA-like mRNA interferase family)